VSKSGLSERVRIVAVGAHQVPVAAPRSRGGLCVATELDIGGTRCSDLGSVLGHRIGFGCLVGTVRLPFGRSGVRGAK
jgi:hypothetical protein